MEEKLEFLFDICALLLFTSCRAMFRQESKILEITKTKLNDKHLVCTCDEGKKCSTEERQYFRDQRSKVGLGLKGLFQLGTMDKQAAKRQQRAVIEDKRRAK